MKKHLIIFIMLISIGFSLSAQKTKDALYLKNGSIIYGKLIEVNGGQYKMQTADGSTLIYPSDEVERFSKVSPFFDGRKVAGFGPALEAGFLIGAQHAQYQAPFSFNILAGFTTNTKNITSIGSGVEFFGRSYTPVFIEYKRIINDRKISPFLFARGGAIIPFGGDEHTQTIINQYDNGPKEYKGGASITIGTGISWAKEDYETYLSFGYRYAHTSYVQQEYSRGEVTYSYSLNRLEIKFGYKF